jgi:ATP-binding cassette subfamily F protein uup
MASLRAKVSTLQVRLDDPTLYARDRDAFTETSAALAAMQSELAEAEDAWLELEILREEIEGQ